MAIRNVVIIVFLAAWCTACEKFVFNQDQAECDYYGTIAADSELVQGLVGWADVEIFSQNFNARNTKAGGKGVGPGLLVMKSPPDPPITGPIYSRELEVRLVGRNRFNPDVIFVGSRSHSGVLIARDGESWEKVADFINVGQRKPADTRVRVSCRP